MLYLKIAGIDPGKTGAITVCHTYINGETFRHEMHDLNSESVSQLPQILQGVHRVFIEKAQAMPKQGVVSMFTYGMGYGVLLGTISTLSIPIEEVRPQTWKKYHDLPRGKEASIQRAQEIFPEGVFVTERGRKLHGRSDSLLIAEYGAGRIREMFYDNDEEVE